LQSIVEELHGLINGQNNVVEHDLDTRTSTPSQPKTSFARPTVHSR